MHSQKQKRPLAESVKLFAQILWSLFGMVLTLYRERCKQGYMLGKQKPYCTLTVDRVIKVLELISKKATEIRKKTDEDLEFLTAPLSILSIHSSPSPNFLNGFTTITRTFSPPKNDFQ